MELLIDLTVLDMQDFDIILEIYWLAAYHPSVNCYEKKVTFQILGQLKIYFIGSKVAAPPQVVSALQAMRMIKKGCMAYLATTRDTQ